MHNKLQIINNHSVSQKHERVITQYFVKPASTSSGMSTVSKMLYKYK